jgi:hypothetical protein
MMILNATQVNKRILAIFDPGPRKLDGRIGADRVIAPEVHADDHRRGLVLTRQVEKQVSRRPIRTALEMNSDLPAYRCAIEEASVVLENLEAQCSASPWRGPIHFHCCTIEDLLATPSPKRLSRYKLAIREDQRIGRRSRNVLRRGWLRTEDGRRIQRPRRKNSDAGF